MVLSTLRVDCDEGPDASPELTGPSGKYPYLLPSGSHAPASPAPTVDLGPYTIVTPALSLYQIASASSFSGHLGLTPTCIVSVPRLPSALDGTAHAKRIAGWSLVLDTLPLAECVYLTVEMIFYISNSCYFNLACLDITIVSCMPIPLVV